MKRIPFSLILIAFLLLSCSESGNNAQAQEESKKSSPKSSTQEKSCLEDFRAEPCTLFSLDDIAKIVNLPVEDGELKEPRNLNNLSLTACGYEWESDRTLTTKVGKRDYTIPDPDKIIIGLFKILNPEKIKGSFAEHFAFQHKNSTDEEMEQFKKSLNNKLEEESDLTKKIGEDFVDLAKLETYSSIDGIGDAASWQTNMQSPQGRLSVLHKNMTFVVVANLSEDRDYNLEKAKKIAIAVIEKCDK